MAQGCSVYKTLHLERQEQGAPTQWPAGLEFKASSGVRVSSLWLSFLICKVGIMMVDLHGFAVSIDRMTLRRVPAT